MKFTSELRDATWAKSGIQTAEVVWVCDMLATSFRLFCQYTQLWNPEYGPQIRQSERDFSSVGLTVTNMRTRLNENTVQAVELLRWEYALGWSLINNYSCYSVVSTDWNYFISWTLESGRVTKFGPALQVQCKNRLRGFCTQLSHPGIAVTMSMPNFVKIALGEIYLKNYQVWRFGGSVSA